MITSPTGPWQPDEWRRALKHAIRTPAELLTTLGLPGDAVDHDPDFPMRVPRSFVARMRPRDPADPLLRQVLPLRAERASDDVSFVADPLAEADAAVARGVIRKYQGRALLISSPACAVHCRYCFRRHFPYDDHRDAGHDQATRTIAADPSLREVILSGGDPWSLGDRTFSELMSALAAVGHLRRIRIHTRLPVVVPARVTAALLDVLRTTIASGKQVVVVVHVNHPNELNTETARAHALLADSSVTLLNQSVLLRGVNDDPAVLVALSERLFQQRVLPYYLHLPDRVAGTGHFFVSEQEACPIHAEAARNLPGYLVPKLVREEPGAAAKRVVA